MMNCQQASHLLSQSQDSPLPRPQRFGLRLHLMMCRACGRFAGQLALLRQAVRTHARQVENDTGIALSEQARDRIAGVLRQQQVEAQQHPDQS
ncbi:MAG: zf-HC2 domain-containing protein [Methylobacterium sp.]|nr:zf-HC2 domain-containing protein [Methylobacterium sp.]